MEQSRDNFLCPLEGVTEEQARVKPSGGGWSILDCVEHVAIAEWGMLRMTQKAPAGDAPTDLECDARILKNGVDRSRKWRSYPSLCSKRARLAFAADNTDRRRLSSAASTCFPFPAIR